jgi:hypothetical protein
VADRLERAWWTRGAMMSQPSRPPAADR